MNLVKPVHESDRFQNPSNSRFNMMTVNSVSLNRQESFQSFRVIFCFFRLKLFPVALGFSLSLRWICVSEWVLGIRSLFLIILLNHLPQEIQNSPSFCFIRSSFAFSVLGYVSDASKFSHSSISPIRISSSQIPPANKACPRRIPQIFLHCEISRLPGGLGHLAHSTSISWNPNTTHHPIQIAMIRLFF